MPIQVGDFNVEEVAEGAESDLLVSYVKVRKLSDDLYPEDEERLVQVIHKFPEDKFEIEHGRIANGGQPYAKLYVQFTPIERRHKTHSIGRFVPVPASEMEVLLRDTRGENWMYKVWREMKVCRGSELGQVGWFKFSMSPPNSRGITRQRRTQ